MLEDRAAGEAGIAVTAAYGDRHERADLKLRQAGLHELAVLDVVEKAHRELGGIVERLLDTHLDQAGQQVLREQRIARAAGKEQVEAHQPSLGIRMEIPVSAASGSSAPLCSAIRQKPLASLR